jgi:hypothetical protein
VVGYRRILNTRSSDLQCVGVVGEHFLLRRWGLGGTMGGEGWREVHIPGLRDFECQVSGWWLYSECQVQVELWTSDCQNSRNRQRYSDCRGRMDRRSSDCQNEENWVVLNVRPGRGGMGCSECQRILD